MKLTSKSRQSSLVVIFQLSCIVLSGQTTYCKDTSYRNKKISASTISGFIQPLPEDAASVTRWIHKHVEGLRDIAATPEPLSIWADKKATTKNISRNVV